MNRDIQEKIDDRSWRVGVIGLGYVGLPLAFESVNQGFRTLGFDVDHAKVDMLMAGKTYIRHFPDETICAANATGRFSATTDFTRIGEVDCILICVPTPLTPNREPDMSYIESTVGTIYPYITKGQLIVLESTTYPGTTDEVMLPILEKSGLTCGVDFYLAYSPEREDPGNKEYSTKTIPKVVGGHTREACDIATYFYKQLVVDAIPVSSTRVAEAVKLTENIFRSVNIALVNELKMIYTKMGIDIWEVIDAAKTKPFGFMPFYPGPGLGGHCIPIDPFYLTWKAREYGIWTRFIEIAGEINTFMPQYVIQELMNALNSRGTALMNARILVIGVAYKSDVDDMRESPSLELLDILFSKGAVPSYHDTYIPEIIVTRKHPALAGMKSVPLTPESIASFDAVLISTAHSDIDYNMVVEHARLVIDTRNATKTITCHRDKIFKA